MTIEKCAIAFLVLIAASMLLQFIRAKKRQKLVQEVDQSVLSIQDQEKWRFIDSSFDFAFKDFRKLQVVKRNMSVFSQEFRQEFLRYQWFSRVEIFVTSSMLLFGISAYYFCS